MATKMNETVLQTQGLTKYYGKRPAVDHLDLQVPRGCICGFIGRNGAGKTTAIKMLLGLLNPTAGSAALLGCDSQDLSPKVRRRIGYVTEGHRLLRWMTINHIEKFQQAFFPDQWDRRFFAEMIDYFELSRKQKIKHLSNGQRAQVSLALALAPNPELLIMDDPTLGLDAAIRRQFLEGMIQLITRQGRTVLFSSHILADVERIADRIAVIHKGRLVANCTLEKLRQSIRKVVMTFAGPPPQQIDIDGLLHHRKDARQLECILVAAEQADIQSWATRLGAEEVEVVEMNLEDQFIEFTASGRQQKRFEWEQT